jgi:hypothetical protein
MHPQRGRFRPLFFMLGVVAGLAFAARLHQAVILRTPDLVLVDTAAIRPEYGDAGLAPVLHFLHDRAPSARLSVRPMPGAEQLVAAEAGGAAQLLPSDVSACVEAVLVACGCG